MNELPSAWATRLRNAPNDSARVLARCKLTTAIYKLAYQTLMARGVAADVARGEANFFAYDVGHRIEAGRVQPGREDAFVRTCARNRAADEHREQSGIRARYELFEEAALLADDRDPERLMAERQEAALLAAKVLRLRAVIETAPPAYAEVLREVHVNGTLIEDLAHRELERRLAADGLRAHAARADADPAALKRARATIDQRLCRARAWLRARIPLPQPDPRLAAGR